MVHKVMTPFSQLLKIEKRLLEIPAFRMSWFERLKQS